MFRIFASSNFASGVLDHGGIYIDPSAEQYGRAQGLRPVATYPQDDSLRCADEEHEEVIGQQYRAHLARLHDYDDLGDLRSEAYIRTLHNICFEELRKRGGPAIFLGIDDIEFAAVEQQVVDTVKAGLDRVRNNFDCILWSDTNPLRFREYEKVTRNCMGQGHMAALEALEQMSGAQLAGGKRADS
ncbi:hypothetical protein P153DRAFT_300742 [Dothidotthia symphoricarpi CBS 119687]|uniref:Uncharacterized protein n=1 Tax=Dothidotthia symphoricarpi CBS 119687 TaxID=1392245 RepID=A0A6A5ZZM9_9PLEO|nr:uncharacterized protein P153DRAFT_300742 [Dothidotthia symphoricarpi CBS 119687]KAF2125202.1 hypothetical protein P153DRAFT_300742 [Dothidotthia symphoricarpi CBS 119687]